jgi:hypothetical protein
MLDLGIWNLEFGIWNLVFGYWYLDIGAFIISPIFAAGKTSILYK